MLLGSRTYTTSDFQQLASRLSKQLEAPIGDLADANGWYDTAILLHALGDHGFAATRIPGDGSLDHSAQYLVYDADHWYVIKFAGQWYKMDSLADGPRPIERLSLGPASVIYRISTIGAG